MAIVWWAFWDYGVLCGGLVGRIWGWRCGGRMAVTVFSRVAIFDFMDSCSFDWVYSFDFLGVWSFVFSSVRV